MKLTVAICTRNPRVDYLAAVLAALAAQTLPRTDWELLIIDSASDHPLSTTLTLPAGLSARFVRVDVSGIVQARFAAITAAAAPLLLFLDDDNVPRSDFLAHGIALAADWPALGCWGPATILARCETPPSPALAAQLSRMACCAHPTDRWSNTLDVIPPGAGLFVRRTIARAYVDFAQADSRRQLVGESADRLFRGDDTDLVFFIVKSGLGAGQFRALSLIHLLPARRLTEDYIVRLVHAAAGSAVFINFLWGVAPPRESRLDRFVYRLKSLRFRGLNRRIAQAHRAGEAEARDLIATLPT